MTATATPDPRPWAAVRTDPAVTTVVGVEAPAPAPAPALDQLYPHHDHAEARLVGGTAG